MAGFDNDVMNSIGIRLEASTAQAIGIMQQTNSVSLINGTGDPEGAVSANPASEFFARDTGLQYRKATGTGNTGWVLNTSTDLYVCPYIVDNANPNGANFSTIQSAMDQAQTDGASITNYITIWVRNGSYTEDLVFHPGIILRGTNIQNISSTGITPSQSTFITGNHTFDANTVCYVQNLNFVVASGDMFSSADTVLFYISTCALINQGAGNIVDFSSGASYLDIADSFIQSNDTGIDFELECLFNFNRLSGSTAGGIHCNANSSINYCINMGYLVVDNSTLMAKSSTFLSLNPPSPGYIVSGSGIVVMDDCHLESEVGGVDSTNIIVGAYLTNCTAGNNKLTVPLVSTTTLTRQITESQGNIIEGISLPSSGSNIDVYPYHHYWGINPTTSVTATLINGVIGDFTIGQELILKDISGTASTNVITVDTANSELIDGAASVQINSNYGSLTLRYDGTNFFII